MACLEFLIGASLRALPPRVIHTTFSCSLGLQVAAALSCAFCQIYAAKIAYHNCAPCAHESRRTPLVLLASKRSEKVIVVYWTSAAPKPPWNLERCVTVGRRSLAGCGAGNVCASGVLHASQLRSPTDQLFAAAQDWCRHASDLQCSAGDLGSAGIFPLLLPFNAR